MPVGGAESDPEQRQHPLASQNICFFLDDSPQNSIINLSESGLFDSTVARSPRLRSSKPQPAARRECIQGRWHPCPLVFLGCLKTEFSFSSASRGWTGPPFSVGSLSVMFCNSHHVQGPNQALECPVHNKRLYSL